MDEGEKINEFNAPLKATEKKFNKDWTLKNLLPDHRWELSARDWNKTIVEVRKLKWNVARDIFPELFKWNLSWNNNERCAFRFSNDDWQQWTVVRRHFEFRLLKCLTTVQCVAHGNRFDRLNATVLGVWGKYLRFPTILFTNNLHNPPEKRRNETSDLADCHNLFSWWENGP